MKIAKTMTMMAVLSVACLAQAKKGDVTTQTFTEKTGNSVVLEVGDCQVNQAIEPVSGQLTTSVELPYVICEELRSYDADVTDNGWFKSNTISNQRNVQSGTVTDVKTFHRDNSANVLLNSNSKGNVLIDAFQNGVDSVSLIKQCELEKKKLEMKARANNSALVQACGGK